MNHREIVTIELEKFLKNKSFANVLDVGCGDRQFQEYFNNKNIDWFGTEIEGTQTEDFFACKMENMNVIHNESFDLVFSCHSFEHCERPIDALREFKRILKPNGWIFIATPFPNEHHVLNSDKDHIFCLNEMQALKLMQYVGFDSAMTFTQKENIEKEQNYNIIWVGKK